MKLNRVYSFLLFFSTLTACTQKQQENKAELSAPTVKIDHPKDTTSNGADVTSVTHFNEGTKFRKLALGGG